MFIFNVILAIIKILLFLFTNSIFSIVVLISPIPQNQRIFLCRVWGWLSLKNVFIG